MTIHTVTQGETIGSIAKKYGIPAELIIRENLLTSPDELVVGESLLIFQPRVVYTVRKGDTLDSLTKLFGLSKNELWQMNPLLRGRDELIVGQELIIEYAEPRLGDLVTVGYIYSDTNQDVLRQILPYLTRLSIEPTDEMTPETEAELIRLAKEYQADAIRFYPMLPENKSFEEIAADAAAKGYAGVECGSCREEGVCSPLRDALLKEGLYLITDLYREDTQGGCDGPLYLVTYDYGEGAPGPYAPQNRVRTQAEAAVERFPAAPITLGYPGFARAWTVPFETGGGQYFIPNTDAVPLAREHGTVIEYDPESAMPHFTFPFGDTGEDIEVWYADARTAKEALDTVSDLGLEGFGVWKTLVFNPQLWQLVNILYKIQKTMNNSEGMGVS